jgi:hypothetical protein
VLEINEHAPRATFLTPRFAGLLRDKYPKVELVKLYPAPLPIFKLAISDSFNLAITTN